MNQFRDYIYSHGLKPPNFIRPGKFYRFAGAGKPAKNTAAWAFLFEDGLGGCFGDFSSGLDKKIWHYRDYNTLSYSEKISWRRNLEEANRTAIAQQEAMHFNAHKKALWIWNASIPVYTNHPYLIRKGIEAYSARVYKGALVLPIIDFDGNLTNLQFIKDNGDKKFLTGGQKHGCCIVVSGDTTEPNRVVICEGWATGCTLAENEPLSLVLAAIDAWNLKPVVVSARDKWPDTKIVVAGDDDRTNPDNLGVTKAIEAANAGDADVVFPQWPEDAPVTLSDFNDLVQWNRGVK
jgi:putative DNA primase/helicase